MSDERVPELSDLSDDDRAAALADADRVYKWIRRNEWIDDADLRAYGERNTIGPDQMNRALAVLQHTGRLTAVPSAPDQS